MKQQNMAVAVVAFLCFLALTTTTSQAVRPALQDPKILLPTASSGGSDTEFDCLSWRLTVETNNLVNWTTVPGTCRTYVADYMLNGQYSRDTEAVADIAIAYAKTLRIPRDGRSIWIFDMDETLLSNLPYYSRPDVAFGVLPRNSTSYYEFVQTGEVPALPATLRLYRTIVKLGIRAVFLAGSSENYREVRTANLKRVGYHTWEMLVLKPASLKGTPSRIFKAQVRDKLVELGYRIVGNIADQWADISGSNVGQRAFKLPNPMYYVG